MFLSKQIDINFYENTSYFLSNCKERKSEIRHVDEFDF